eukprot:RCo038181
MRSSEEGRFPFARFDAASLPSCSTPAYTHTLAGLGSEISRCPAAHREVLAAQSSLVGVLEPRRPSGVSALPGAVGPHRASFCVPPGVVQSFPHHHHHQLPIEAQNPSSRGRSRSIATSEEFGFSGESGPSHSRLVQKSSSWWGTVLST